jgi:hypothetical protein
MLGFGASLLASHPDLLRRAGQVAFSDRVSGHRPDRSLHRLRRSRIPVFDGAKILFVIFLVLAVRSFPGHGYRGGSYWG